MSRPATPGGYNLKRQPLAGSGPSSRVSTPLAKATVSLEEWESKSPLTEDQVQSIANVRERFGERALPEKFNKAESVQTASRPTTPRPRQFGHIGHSRTGSSVPSTPGSPGPSSLSKPDPSHPHTIITPQQFHEHFAALALSAEHEQDSLYREHLAEIAGLRDKCDGLIGLLQDGEGEVVDMLNALEYVEERSESLRGACEDLLEEQTHLLTHTSQLAHRLSYFTFLETAQRQLNNPGNDLVLSPDFLPMVRRLDECISYLGEHHDFKDAELYLIRYQQCMTRSMTLIRLHFVASVKALGQEISKRLGDKAMSETASRGLLYNRFSTLSQTLRPLISELEQRIGSNKDELPQILSDCQSAFLSTRQALMGVRVEEEVSRMNPTRTDVVELTRAGCSYLKQTCMDEFNLFKLFFNSGEHELYGYLEVLCDYLYDHLRPRILREPSLVALQEVCTVLQALMVHEVTEDDDPDEAIVLTPESASPNPDDFFGNHYSPRSRSGSLRIGYSPTKSILSRTSSLTATPAIPMRRRRPLSRLHTELLLKMVLQDAQTRLVFRAQSLIQADVQYYTAKPGDLEYPEKLGASEPGQPLVPRRNFVSLDVEDDDEPPFLSLPDSTVQDTWYPTLRSTLWVLSCLYTYVDADVFTDLAQEAVSSCRKSLASASDLLGAQKDKQADCKLFLVRHLLILKEMTAGLDLGRASRNYEWAGVTDFLRSLLENATFLLGYGRGSTGRAQELLPDAKANLDRDLKRACEELIAQCTSSAAAPLSVFLDRASAYLSSPSHGDLNVQDWAAPTSITAIHDEFRKTATAAVVDFKAQLTLYLQDEETVRVLLPPALSAIVDMYRRFHDLVRSEYEFSTTAAISTPSAISTQLEEAIKSSTSSIPIPGRKS